MAYFGATRVSPNIGSADVTFIIRDFATFVFPLQSSVSKHLRCGIAERFLGQSAAILLRYTVSIKHIAKGKLFITLISLVKQFLLQ